MWWYCGSIVIDDNGCPQIEYTASFTRLLCYIYQLEEEYIKKVSSIDSSSSNIHKGDFELLVERTLIFEK